jgi:hypothetical protein
MHSRLLEHTPKLDARHGNKFRHVAIFKSKTKKYNRFFSLPPYVKFNPKSFFYDSLLFSTLSLLTITFIGVCIFTLWEYYKLKGNWK